MFKIGEGEAKISVTTWNGQVKVHFRKSFQSSFDRKKFYPSKQGIALTPKEWSDLKALIADVDETISCTSFFLEEMKEQGEQEDRKISYNRQLAVCEVNERDLQMFNDQVVNEIIRLSNEECEPQIKKVKFSPVAELSCFGNWSHAFQDERIMQEQNKFEGLPPECYDGNANFSFEF